MFYFLARNHGGHKHLHSAVWHPYDPLFLVWIWGFFSSSLSPGEVCCPDQGNLRVSVGLGDTCCGLMPFSSTAGQICCNGSLHDGYRSQCCGGKLVSKEVVCCGDPHKGTAHTLVPGKAFISAVWVRKRKKSVYLYLFFNVEFSAQSTLKWDDRK